MSPHAPVSDYAAGARIGSIYQSFFIKLAVSVQDTKTSSYMTIPKNQSEMASIIWAITTKAVKNAKILWYLKTFFLK